AAAQAAAEALGGDFAAVLAPGAGSLAVVGSHELPPEVAALVLPRALVDAAERNQPLFDAAHVDIGRFFHGAQS
ncbi:MAG TPA: hypothetical protein VGL86_17010, partial [Polyangia bacterium]